MPRDKDRPGYVVLIAALVCVVCALLVSSAVVLLRPVQDRNALLARQRNILEVAGLYQAGQPVDAQFTRIEPRVVDLATGGFVEGADACASTSRRPRATPKRATPWPARQTSPGSTAARARCRSSWCAATRGSRR